MNWRERLLVTRPEAAEILSCSVSKVDRLVREQKLRAKKEGRQVGILTASLIEYAEGITREGATPGGAPLSREAREISEDLRRWASG
jgi:excisionase family DNA binding protein